jgi:glycosyltransferase involved in cell wall biosynthesis
LVHRGPTVVFIHGWDPRWEKLIASSPVLRFLFRKTFGRVERVYVLARKYRDRLTQWGLDPQRVQCTSTMFDGSLFEGIVRTRPRPTKGDEVQVLFMSRLVREKGALETIEAFATVAAETPGLRLVCAGDGPQRAALQEWVEAHGLNGRVTFPGFVRGARKAQLLLDSDLFVFPTRHGEGCPVSLLEAMASGLAIVTTDAGGIADVFQGGHNGILLESGTDSALVAGAIRSLIGDVDRLRDIGQQNASSAQKRFEADPWCRRLEEDYLALAG